MRLKGRLYLISVLLIASIILITSSTMAFYSQSMSFTADLATAKYELRVNESTAETQTLLDMTIAPGETLSRDIKIDTSGLGTPSTLTVTLAVHASGALPEGFVVSLDGTPVSGSDLTAVKTMESAEARVIDMTVTVAWTAISDTDYARYKDLSITYGVTVAAEQSVGG